MTMIRKLVILICLVPMLFACKEKMTETYLLTHPMLLKDKVAACQRNDDETSQDVTDCHLVMDAAAQFAVILNEQQANPEQFGEQLMQMELLRVKTKDDVIAAQNAVHNLMQHRASEADITKANMRYHEAQITDDTLRNKINIHLAVIGLESPQ